MTESEKLFEKKEKLAKERDLCAELYNVWITKLHEFQNDPVKYEMYVGLINNMEPYGQLLKEEIREINREICKIEGVDNIEDTPYVHYCEAKYGNMTPNND
jgi:hypothetical protein